MTLARIGRTAAVAAAYAIVGLLALRLAVAPDYAAQVFPSAGIALAAAYVYGAPGVAGAALGSWLVNAVPRLVDGSFSGIQAALPLATAAGAAAQAYVGAALLRGFVGRSLRLETPGEYLRFALLGGLLGCLVSASVALLAFSLAGVGTPAELVHVWWTWWTGDAIGVLIGAPIALAFIAEPRPLWAPRRLAVALPLTVAVLLVGVGIAQVGRWEQTRLDNIFRQQVTGLATELKQNLASNLSALHALHAVFDASEDVTREEFRRATAHWLKMLPSLQALGWSARVPAGRHAAFEQRLRAEMPGYLLFDRGPDGARRLPAPERDLIAITYIEPRAGNEGAVGVNALSIPAAAAAIERTADSGNPQATSGFRLTQETGEQIGVVVYLAVRTADAPKAPLDGVVFVTMRMDDVIRSVSGFDNGDLTLCLTDVSAVPAQHLAGGPACTEPLAANELTLQIPLVFAGRQWLVQFRAGAAYVARHRDWTAWWFAVTALAATGLLGAFLLLASGRTQRITEMVEQRTAALRREIGERQAKEQALLAAERRFRDVFEAASVGLAYTDLDGRFVRVNARFAEICGRSPRQLRSCRAAELGALDEPAADALRQLLAGQRSALRCRTEYLRPDGSRIPVEVGHALSRDADGRPLYVVMVVEDLRERLAREAAESASRAKTEFLSRMSHELRTPLNAMLGFAQLLQIDADAPLTTQQRERVEHIQRAGWHLLEMINDVLDLSRVEAGTLQLTLQPLDLRPLVRECGSMHGALLQTHEVSLSLALADDACFVAADAMRLRQVISNLLSNAIKYNRPGGRVEIRSLASTGSTVMLRVTDTGSGLSREQMAQLFQPFNRLGRSDVDGTGIGLVIARHLVQLMNGRLEVDSTPGRGSTFTIVLQTASPVATSAESATAATTPPQETTAAMPPKRIVYIEDNAVNVEVVRGMLQLSSRPLQLQAHGLGAEGLRAVLEQPPDLLLLDLHLPDMSGLDILQRLRAAAATARLPIVVLSADAMNDQVQEGLAAGADAYLTKPLQLDKFLALVDQMLGARAG